MPLKSTGESLYGLEKYLNLMETYINQYTIGVHILVVVMMQRRYKSDQALQ